MMSKPSIVQTKGMIATFLMVIILILFLGTIFIKNIFVVKENATVLIKEKMLEDNYKQLSEIMNECRIQIHDMKHHLQILRGYTDDADIEKIRKYLDEIREPYLKLEKTVWTQMQMLNLILNQKRLEAEEKEILVTYNIDRDFLLPLKESEICALFCNLLDNAIEACEEIKQGNRWISLEL